MVRTPEKPTLTYVIVVRLPNFLFAVVLREQGKLDQALSLQREAYEMRRRVLGKRDPATLASMYSYALLQIGFELGW